VPTRFIYFDLGNVLLHFDHRRACRQVAELTGLDQQQVWDVVFAGGLELEYEAGRLSTRQFYEAFCTATGVRPDLAAFAHAASAIFEVNALIKPVVAGLAAARRRLGLLSNTNEMHWEHVAGGRYGLVPDVFEQVVLSYRVGAVKPDRKIFDHAAEVAGVAPADVLYIDDTAGHVAAAKALGWDAVRYTGTPELVAELRRRGLGFNY
jgi:putative hydrolase of the HAD superfamily